MSPRYPRGSLAEMLLGDLDRTGAVHLPAYIEQEAPNAFFIFCACGWQGTTVWGRAHAEEIFEKHRSFHGAGPTIFLP